MTDLRNPELLRYVRSELRPSRIIITMTGTLAGCALMAMFILANSDRRQLEAVEYWRNVHAAILTASSIILVLWSLLNASQAIVSERTHRTFDFWRTTRLSPLTLAVGKLFGAPLLPWLQFATAVPVVLFTGILAGHNIITTMGCLVVIAVFNVALSAVALCASMRAQDARRANLMMLAILLGTFQSVNFRGQGLPSAWTALTPAPAVGMLLDGRAMMVMIFNHAVPSLLVTFVLSLVVIAWCLAALVRCVKFEPEERSLYSQAQVVGVSATFLLFVYAAFQPLREAVSVPDAFNPATLPHLNLDNLLITGIAAGLGCIYFTINSTLLTRDNLRQQLRTQTAGQVATYMVRPWVATSAVALIAAILGVVGYSAALAGSSVTWFAIVLMYVSVAIYAVRDGLFLQWMISQRVKAPVLKGSVVLGCYYLAASTISALLAGPEHMLEMLRWLAPGVANPGQLPAGEGWMACLALVPPMATAVLIAAGIFHKMRRSQKAIGLAEA